MRWEESPREKGELKMLTNDDLSFEGEVLVQPPDGELDVRFYLSPGQIVEVYENISTPSLLTEY